VSAMPFDEDNPPVEITYRARYVQNWNEVKNSAGRVPRHARYGKETFERTLVPYGCTRIRIAHHPVFKENKSRLGDYAVGIFSVTYSYVRSFKNPPLLSQIHPFFHLKRREEIKQK